MSTEGSHLLHVALHATVLSAFAFIVVALIRHPQRRARVSLMALMAIGIVPWFSPLRPLHTPNTAAPVPDREQVAGIARLPEWTVIRFPAPLASAAGLSSHTETGPLSSSPSLRHLTLSIWIAGSTLLGIMLACSAIRLSAWNRLLSPPSDEEWLLLREAFPAAPARTRFRIRRDGGGPCVSGPFRPLIVIPSFLLETPHRRGLRWSVRHEVRHWQGQDATWSLAIEFVRLLWWWNPFVHGLINHWKAARESVCDLFAGGEDRTGYGEFLISMAARPAMKNPLTVTMTRFRRFRCLRARIRFLLDAPPSTGTPSGKRDLLATGLLFLGISFLISGLRVSGEESGNPPPASASSPAASDQPPAPPPAEKRPLQFKLKQTILLTTENPLDGKHVLDAKEVQAVMRKASLTAGNMLLTLPSVIARSGESARVEVIREEPGSIPLVKWNEKRTGRYAGWSLFFSSSFSGGKLAFDMHAGYGFVPGKHFSKHSASGSVFDEDENIDWPALVQKSAAARAELGNHDTLATSLGEVEPSCFATLFHTVEAIDAAGRSVETFEQARGEIPEEIPGTIRLRGTIIERSDLEEFVGMGKIETPRLAFPITRDHAQRLQEKPGVTRLPTVEVPAGKFVRPWKEVEGISFQGTLFLTGEEGKKTASIQLTSRTLEDRDDFPPYLEGLFFHPDRDRIPVFQLKPERPGAIRVLLLEMERVE